MSSIRLILCVLLALTACSQRVEPRPPGKYGLLDTFPDFGGDWEQAQRDPFAAAPAVPPAPSASAPGSPPPSVTPFPGAARLTAPLNTQALAELKRRQSLAQQGKVYAQSAACLPTGGAGFWLDPHAKEIVMSPDKILIWSGSADGVSYRRIYIDGRRHDPSADPSYLGESIGRWTGDTLIVDITNFLDSVPVTGLGDAFVPNGGGMHVVERWHLLDKDTLQIDLVSEAPKTLEEPWHLNLTYKRVTGQQYEMHEAVCAQNTTDSADAQGFQQFNTTPPADIQLPPGMKLKIH